MNTFDAAIFTLALLALLFLWAMWRGIKENCIAFPVCCFGAAMICIMAAVSGFLDRAIITPPTTAEINLTVESPRWTEWEP